jgi:hypothetical protein
MAEQSRWGDPYVWGGPRRWGDNTATELHQLSIADTVPAIRERFLAGAPRIVKGLFAGMRRLYGQGF